MMSLDRKVQDMSLIDRAERPRFVAALSLFVLLCVGITGCCCPKPQCPRNGDSGENGDGENGTGENGTGENGNETNGPPGPAAMRRVRFLNARKDRSGKMRAFYTAFGSEEELFFDACAVNNNEMAFATLPPYATAVRVEFDADGNNAYEYTPPARLLDPNAAYIEYFIGITDGPEDSDSYEWMIGWVFSGFDYEAHCARWEG